MTHSENGFENQVLIMDEIDGLDANKDCGGIMELIELIEKLPMICICNNQYSDRIQSLKNYCFCLPFERSNSTETADAIIMPILKFHKNLSSKFSKQLITMCDKL